MHNKDSYWEHATRHRELSSVLCDDQGRWDGEVGGRIKREGKICILITDSHYCTAGTNTTVESNYPPFEKKNGLINFHDAPKTLKRAKKLKCKFLM